MKTIKLLLAIVVCGFMITSCSNEQLDSIEPIESDLANRSNGNYSPTGKHYNLNIIGMSKDKTADMTGNNGHRIFVKLWGKTKIMLIEGDDFAVLDANGTDGRAEFQLPNPDPDGDGISSYSIWIRALGKPGGKAVITTCADADLTDEYYEVCSAEYLEVESTRGPAKFENVSRTLLTIYVDADFTFTDGDGNEVTIKKGRYTIFDPIFEDYFWKYENSGLRLLQMRFYEMATDIS